MIKLRLTVDRNNVNSQLMAKTNSFGQQLAKWRKEAGMNQAELARRLKVSPTYISNLERDYSPSAKSGKPQPSKEFVDSVARVFHIPISEARLAAGYAPPTIDPADNQEYKESDWAVMFYDYRELSEKDKEELKTLIEIVRREFRERRQRRQQ